MNDSIEHIILKSELTQSNLFGDLYNELLGNIDSQTFSNLLVDDLSELLNSILLKWDNITPFQKEMLDRIFDEFNNIRLSIDPKRLKPFESFLNNDDELLLFRETEFGITNIIINPEECIAFSFISNKTKERKFYFVEILGDFEKLAYDFFSR